MRSKLKNFKKIFGNSEIENLWNFRKPEVFNRQCSWSILNLGVQILLCEGQVLKNFKKIFGNSEIENLWNFRKPEVFKRRYFWSIWTLDSNPVMRGTGPKKFHRNFWEHSKGVTFEVFEPWVQILSIYARDRIWTCVGTKPTDLESVPFDRSGTPAFLRGAGKLVWPEHIHEQTQSPLMSSECVSSSGNSA